MICRRRVLGWAAVAGASLTLGPVIASAFGSGGVAKPNPGSGKFEAELGGRRNWRIRVFYHRPMGTGADVPVVFIIHGLARDAANYRDAWVQHAEAGRYLVVTPEFSVEDFPKSRAFNQGNVLGRDGVQVPADEWSFNVIERVFDIIADGNDLGAKQYDLYGHSAGSQLAHRLNWFLPEARVRTIAAANAGYYTFADSALPYPAGLKDPRLRQNNITKALARDMVVLLGAHDIDPEHKSLLKNPQAMAQGRHRLERGHNFFTSGQRLASTLGLPFGWRLIEVEGIAHSNRGMALAAAPLLGRPHAG